MLNFYKKKITLKVNNKVFTEVNSTVIIPDEQANEMTWKSTGYDDLKECIINNAPGILLSEYIKERNGRIKDEVMTLLYDKHNIKKSTFGNSRWEINITYTLYEDVRLYDLKYHSVNNVIQYVKERLFDKENDSR